jgi:hypothetical protein
LFGLGYGILQPLFQSFVTGTAPAPKRGDANAIYLLTYDIGIGSLIMGVFQENAMPFVVHVPESKPARKLGIANNQYNIPDDIDE